MRAPADFIVTRELLTDPETSPSSVAKRTGLRATTAIRAYHRIVAATQLDPAALLHHALHVAERPRIVGRRFRLPNPAQWELEYRGAKWLSGEPAAALEGFDLVPERWLWYVPRDRLEHARDAAVDAYANVATDKTFNLEVRMLDPWLHPDDADPLVPRGQRLIDYWESGHIQLTAALSHARTLRS